jgi:hypothetical protein
MVVFEFSIVYFEWYRAFYIWCIQVEHSAFWKVLVVIEKCFRVVFWE